MEMGEGDIAVELSEEGAQIDFFPDEEIIDTTPFDANLAEYVDEGELGRIAYQLITDYEEDKGESSRLGRCLRKRVRPTWIQVRRQRQTFSRSIGRNPSYARRICNSVPSASI